MDAQPGVGLRDASGAPHRVDFEAMELGKPPAGFSVALTGKGRPAAWSIAEDPAAPAGPKVLVQTSSDDTSHHFPLCLHDAFSGVDPDLSVSFKPIAGRVDRAAGLVWRYRDADNYCVVRANALENNVVLHKVENGKRSDLKPEDAGLFSKADSVTAFDALSVRGR